MVHCFCTFLKFCYIAHSDTITEQTIERLEDTLTHFHQYCLIFQDTGVCFNISLLCQHSMAHYSMLICLFGAPNSLCSSITESKHIEEVKGPWQWSNRYNVIFQMLVTIQCHEKLAASQADFEAWGMLNGNILDTYNLLLGMLYAISTLQFSDRFSQEGQANTRSMMRHTLSLHLLSQWTTCNLYKAMLGLGVSQVCIGSMSSLITNWLDNYRMMVCSWCALTIPWTQCARPSSAHWPILVSTTPWYQHSWSTWP